MSLSTRHLILLVLVLIACLTFTVHAQDTTTPTDDTDTPTDDEETPPDVSLYVPPNFIFLSVLISSPEHGITPHAGLFQRVESWANGCVAVDVQSKIISYYGPKSKLTVDIITTTDLIGGCSLSALELAIVTYKDARIESFERSTPTDISTGCVTRVWGLWMPTCLPACETWTCAAQIAADAKVAPYFAVTLMTLFIALFA